MTFTYDPNLSRPLDHIRQLLTQTDVTNADATDQSALPRYFSDEEIYGKLRSVGTFQETLAQLASAIAAQIAGRGEKFTQADISEDYKGMCEHYLKIAEDARAGLIAAPGVTARGVGIAQAAIVLPAKTDLPCGFRSS